MLFVLGAISIMLLSSCKKDEEISETPTINTVDYSHLTVGNYWVYENYILDSLGVATLMDQVDTVTVDRDTIINGQTYFVLTGTRYPTTESQILEILRDSGTYIVSSNGEIIFSSTNFTDTLREDTLMTGLDTIVYTTYQMEHIIGDISVPAGLFSDVLDFKGTVNSPIYSYLLVFPKYVHYYYAPGIGKIYSKRPFLISPMQIEQKLVEYYVQ